MKRVLLSMFSAFSVFAGSAALAQDTGTPSADALKNAHPKRPYSPYAGGALPS